MSEPSASAVERADTLVAEWLTQNPGWETALARLLPDLIERIARALDAAALAPAAEVVRVQAITDAKPSV